MKNENQFLKKPQATGLDEIIQDKRKAAKTESWEHCNLEVREREEQEIMWVRKRA